MSQTSLHRRWIELGVTLMVGTVGGILLGHLLQRERFVEEEQYRRRQQILEEVTAIFNEQDELLSLLYSTSGTGSILTLTSEQRRSVTDALDRVFALSLRLSTVVPQLANYYSDAIVDQTQNLQVLVTALFGSSMIGFTTDRYLDRAAVDSLLRSSGLEEERKVLAAFSRDDFEPRRAEFRSALYRLVNAMTAHLMQH